MILDCRATMGFASSVGGTTSWFNGAGTSFAELLATAGLSVNAVGTDPPFAELLATARTSFITVGAVTSIWGLLAAGGHTLILGTVWGRVAGSGGTGTENGNSDIGTTGGTTTGGTNVLVVIPCFGTRRVTDFREIVTVMTVSWTPGGSGTL